MPAGRRRRPPWRVGIVAVTLFSLSASLVFLSSAARADGSWDNANGTSTTATGLASTDSSQNALVFAIDTDHTVTSCSSTDGTCSAGQPDGSKSFEVFASAATSAVDFSVVTSAPIACAAALALK